MLELDSLLLLLLEEVEELVKEEGLEGLVADALGGSLCCSKLTRSFSSWAFFFLEAEERKEKRRGMACWKQRVDWLERGS